MFKTEEVKVYSVKEHGIARSLARPPCRFLENFVPDPGMGDLHELQS